MNMVDANGASLLMTACKKGHVDIVERMLNVKNTLFWSDCFKLKNSPVEFSTGNISLGPVLSKKTKIIINELWTFEINVSI